MKKILSVIGTRPEVIKMAPVIKKIEQTSDLESIVVATSQHREMTKQMCQEFSIFPDIDLDIMKPAQTLSYITEQIAVHFEKVLIENRPDFILVQGDTTSACICGLIAFYNNIPVGHVEAGLRTYNPDFPYPEEINRQLISRLATFNFAPTVRAKENLLNEKIDPPKIFFTGNTIVDALQYLLEQKNIIPHIEQKQNSNNRKILVTAHRRENFGKPMENICLAINDLTERFNDLEIIFPVHPNPKVRKTVAEFIRPGKQIHLLDPLGYSELIEIMAGSTLILTDSGGIQEEAPTLHKPVLVLRDVTERPEIVKAGGAIMVGSHRDKIVRETSRLLTDKRIYDSMVNIRNPFGDGHAADRIIDTLMWYFNIEIEKRTPALKE